MDMAQIRLEHIGKRFTVYERPPGRFGALKGLVKRQKRIVRALEDVSFSIEEGELVGYIGPNGAGKSTTAKVMSGILTPEEGSCTILGRHPLEAAGGPRLPNRGGVRPAQPAVVGCAGQRFL